VTWNARGTLATYNTKAVPEDATTTTATHGINNKNRYKSTRSKFCLQKESTLYIKIVSHSIDIKNIQYIISRNNNINSMEWIHDIPNTHNEYDSGMSEKLV